MRPPNDSDSSPARSRRRATRRQTSTGPLPIGCWSKSGGRRGGYDGSDRHGQELGKDVEWLLQRHHHGRIVGHGDARDVLGLAGRVCPGAADGIQGPAAAAGAAGCQGPEHGSAYVGRLDRPAIVEAWRPGGDGRCTGRPALSVSQERARPGCSWASGSNWVRLSKSSVTTSPVGTSVDSAGSSDLGS